MFYKEMFLYTSSQLEDIATLSAGRERSPVVESQTTEKAIRFPETAMLRVTYFFFFFFLHSLPT
jgi:hypothetical protein